LTVWRLGLRRWKRGRGMIRPMIIGLCVGVIASMWTGFDPWRVWGYKPTMTVLLIAILGAAVLWREKK
jgi:hypothetical protein